MLTSENMYRFFVVGSLLAAVCTLTDDSQHAETESASPSDGMVRAVSAIAQTAVNAFGNMLSFQANHEDQDQDQKNLQQNRKRDLCGDAAQSRKTRKVC